MNGALGEILIAGAVIGLALLPLSAALGRWRPRLRRPAALLPPLAFLGFAAAALLYSPSSIEERDVSYRPIEVPGEDYASSRACQACHPRPYATWHDSYHRTMTQVASERTIAAAHDESFEFVYGYEYAWKRLGDEFWVASNDPAWAEYGSLAHDVHTREQGFVQRPVVMVTGSHHEQVYWFRTGTSRQLRAFPFIYRIGEDRWLPYPAAFLMPLVGPEDVRPNWNEACIHCHTTDGRPGHWGPSRVDSHASEFGIACEACHGPAKEHVVANRDPSRRYRLHLSDDADPTIVNPAELPAARATDVCGSCHAMFSVPLESLDAVRVGGYPFEPGEELAKSRDIVWPEPEHHTPAIRLMLESKTSYIDSHFWKDGVPLINGREYNAVTRAPCFDGGEFSCMSCHQLHKEDDDPRSIPEWADDQLGAGMRGNRACLQCHPMDSEAVVEHTHHPEDSEGSRCYNCHMPNTVYGLLKATRDHRVRSPSASETFEAERPNACNLCHFDRTLEWAGRHLESWYGIPQPELPDPEYGRTALGPLMLLRGNAAQRAFIAWHMGWGPAREASGDDWVAPFLGQLLEDPYPAVRQIAHRSLRSLEGYEGLELEALASAKEQARAKWRVWEIWEQHRPQNGRSNPEEILLDESGRPQVTRMNRLLDERDDRIMVLEE